MLHLVPLDAALRDRGVGLRVLDQGIDTRTAEGRAMFGMLYVVAKLQRGLIVADTRNGLAAHHAQQHHHAGTQTVQRIADLLQVPRSTIYGHLNKTSIGRRPTAKATLAA